MSLFSHRPLAWVGLAISGLSLLALIAAVPQLTGGIGDVPDHWWSALPVVGILAGVGLMAYAVRD